MSHRNSGSRGSSSRPNSHLPRHNSHVGASKPSANQSVGIPDGKSHDRGSGKYSYRVSQGSGSKHLNDKRNPNLVYRPKSRDVISNSIEAEGSHKKQPESQGIVALDSDYGGDHRSLSAHSDSQNIQWDVISNSVEAEGSRKKQPESQGIVALDSDYGGDHHSLSAHSDSQNIQWGVSRIKLAETPQKEAESRATKNIDYFHKEEVTFMQDESPKPLKVDTKGRTSEEKGSKTSSCVEDSGFKPLDICPPKKESPFMLKPSLLVKNRQKRNEVKRGMEGQIGKVLRSGMVLLKNYLSISDQVNLVKTCRDLGLGPGGFYQPGYRDGASLHLKMMCLGKNWDPEKSVYEDVRSMDSARPPMIPAKFNQLVGKAIQDSNALIERNNETSNEASKLPWMSPDICIVNFYSASGKLGLHQDRDETPESLHKGLPVVSFSVGDTAEFLYGDERNVDKAQMVMLESGDVMIFGGKSRHIFHGVASILSNTTPPALQEETNFLPGRLNLTFRQY